MDDPHVALEIVLRDGRRDLLMAADSEELNSKESKMVQPDWDVQLEGELCWIRKGPKDKVERVALARARSVEIGKVVLKLEKEADFIEFKRKGGRIVAETAQE